MLCLFGTAAVSRKKNGITAGAGLCKQTRDIGERRMRNRVRGDQTPAFEIRTDAGADIVSGYESEFLLRERHVAFGVILVPALVRVDYI